jgi:hypothetical protein
MQPRTYALVALAIPFAAIALMMAPILVNAGRFSEVTADEFVQYVLPLLVSFGFPQYVVFAIVLAVVLLTRRMSGVAIHRLAIWAPVLFVPFLAGPFMFAADSLVGALQILALFAALGLTVGYVCVFFAVGLWPAFVRDDAPPPSPAAPPSDAPPTP